jgi:cytochrome c biogenesis protein CcdA
MYNLGRSSILAITAPASLLGRAMPLKYYWFILLNGVAYVLFGLLVELFRPLRTR